LPQKTPGIEPPVTAIDSDHWFPPRQKPGDMCADAGLMHNALNEHHQIFEPLVVLPNHIGQTNKENKQGGEKIKFDLTAKKIWPFMIHKRGIKKNTEAVNMTRMR
tara:strand:+ start:672 stop:986 length:315 start_codon:yes stop_codon:yes gene_type:complete